MMLALASMIVIVLAVVAVNSRFADDAGHRTARNRAAAGRAWGWN